VDRLLGQEAEGAAGLTQPAVLPAAADLMEKYSNLPMDFADATLTLLAEQAELLEILTLDRRGFTVYRTRDSKPFHLVLDAT
jgi:predicted nucleic acid-binding protein